MIGSGYASRSSGVESERSSVQSPVDSEPTGQRTFSFSPPSDSSYRPSSRDGQHRSSILPPFDFSSLSTSRDGQHTLSLIPRSDSSYWPASRDRLVELTGTKMCQSCQESGQTACHVGSKPSCLACDDLRKECLFVRDICVVGPNYALPYDVLIGNSSSTQTPVFDITSSLQQSYAKSVSTLPPTSDMYTSPSFSTEDPHPAVAFPSTLGRSSSSTYRVVPGHRIDSFSENCLQCECGSRFTGEKSKNVKSNYKRHLDSLFGEYECPVCEMIINRVDNFRAHVSMHQRIEMLDANLNAPSSSSGPSGIDGVTCSQCSAIFQGNYAQSNLRRHVREKHESSDELTCPDCGYTCNRAEHLRRHRESKHPG